jgi:predicted nucleotidyltransferase
MRALSDQSYLRFPLNSLLGSPGSLRVLRALHLSKAPQGVSALAAATGLTPQGVRNVLTTLVELGAAEAAGVGRAQVYAANPSHPLHDLLRTLFAAERSRWQQLRDALRRVLDKTPAVHAAWLYGSVARGEDRPGSDIDLAIHVKGGSVERVLATVRKELRPMEDAFGVAFSVVGISQGDVARQSTGADPGNWWAAATEDAQPLKGSHPAQLAQRPIREERT